jgi:hypothetical protein
MIINLLVLILGLVGASWLGWISVQSLRQGALLRSLPKGNAGALEGSWLAIHGTVKVLAPLDIPGIGPCLWCRTIEKQLESLAWRIFSSRSSNWRTVSDLSQMAKFSITAGGQEVEVAELPTEVQDTSSRTEKDSDELINFDSSYARECIWLPVVGEATVIGRIERRPGGRVVIRDPQLGLLLSPNPPDEAARIEFAKGIFGMLGVAAGILGLIWMLLHLDAR